MLWVVSNPLSNAQDFEKAMREHGSQIYTLAVRLTGSLVDGQDLAQDVFARAYSSRERFRGESSPGTWFYRICVNTWKNRVRFERRRSFWSHFSLSQDSVQGDGPDRDLIAPGPGIDAPLETADRQNMVQDGLSRLSVEDRAIVVLRDMENQPYETIAELLEIPIGTVRSRLSRGRERLRQILEKHLDLR